MKKAFSMVELIFVIVLLGILVSIGGNLLPDNRLLQYTNETSMKIKETQKNAIGNDINGFGTPWSKESNSTCIESSDFEHAVIDGNETLCFDEFGRPYRPSPQEQLLLHEVNVTVTYNNTDKNISVQPMSGYVIIRYML